MSTPKRPTSASSSSSFVSPLAVDDREIDPLLKDLSEKKQSFRRNVVSLAAELKGVRRRLASQQQSFLREIQTRQEAEETANKMEEEMRRLQKSLVERNGQLQASSAVTEKYLQELDDLQFQLSATQVTADASAASAHSAGLQCLELLKELDEKNCSLTLHENRVSKLAEQLDLLQKDLQERESSQIQLKDEVIRIEHDIMQALVKAGPNKECELRKILDEVSPKNFEKMNKLLNSKDEEITKLRDEIKIMTDQWKLKTKVLDSQLEKHRRADQDLKKKVIRLEFCLQEARTQTRKLQRMSDCRDKTLKELRQQLAALRQQGGSTGVKKQKFWETFGFKIGASMSVFVLVLFSKL